MILAKFNSSHNPSTPPPPIIKITTDEFAGFSPSLVFRFQINLVPPPTRLWSISENPNVIKKLVKYLKESFNIFYLYIWLLLKLYFFLLLFIIFIIMCIKDVLFNFIYITLHATPVWINYCLLERQSSNFDLCISGAVSPNSFHHPPEVLLVKFSL